MSKSVGELSVSEFHDLIEKVVDSVPKTFFVSEVERIVEKKFEDERNNFWVPAEQHYNQHKMYEECLSNKKEWAANHVFVSKMRKDGQQVYSIGLKLAAVAFFGFLTATFWDGITQFVGRIWQK